MVRVEIMMEEEGLSSLPENTNGGIPSLLLFNSSKCVYKEYGGVNNLVGVDAQERESTTDLKADLHHAPTTLLDGDLLPDVAAMDLTFKPELGEMAGLDLPSNMPLPNIADIQVRLRQICGYRKKIPTPHAQNLSQQRQVLSNLSSNSTLCEKKNRHSLVMGTPRQSLRLPPQISSRQTS